MRGSGSQGSAQLGVSAAKQPSPCEEPGWRGAAGVRKEGKAGCGDPKSSGPPGSQRKLQPGARGTVLDGDAEPELASGLSGTAVPSYGNPGVDR